MICSIKGHSTFVRRKHSGSLSQMKNFILLIVLGLQLFSATYVAASAEYTAPTSQGKCVTLVHHNKNNHPKSLCTDQIEFDEDNEHEQQSPFLYFHTSSLQRQAKWPACEYHTALYIVSENLFLLQQSRAVLFGIFRI